MVSQTAEYALRTVLYLGNQPGVLRTTAQISQAIDAPRDYLAKVLQGLSRAQIVRSQRGLHGGFTLATAPEELAILDVVQAVDVLQRQTNCPLGKAAHAHALCPLHRRLDRLWVQAATEFRETTISELLEQEEKEKGVCSLPCISDPVPAAKECKT